MSYQDLIKKLEELEKDIVKIDELKELNTVIYFECRKGNITEKQAEELQKRVVTLL